jgi:hypothetical protein
MRLGLDTLALPDAALAELDVADDGWVIRFTGIAPTAKVIDGRVHSGQRCATNRHSSTNHG